MDRDTLANHISNLSIPMLNEVAKIIIQDIFKVFPILVDGAGDGGTDIVGISAYGERSKVAYQLTTQKKAIKSKCFADAKKSIDKLGAERFFFITSCKRTEVEDTLLEAEIESLLNIKITCFSANKLASLLIEANLLGKFLEVANYPLPRSLARSDFDYREMALHSYTLHSSDAKNLKGSIYDDTLILVISNEGALSEDDLIDKTLDMLGLSIDRSFEIKNKIGALFGRGLLVKTSDGKIDLAQDVLKDVENRKRIFEKEFDNLLSAQVDVMKDYGVDWTKDDSKKISIWISNTFISQQIKLLREIKASIVSNPLFKNTENGKDSIVNYVVKHKKMDDAASNEATQKLLDIASTLPLIQKISRAVVYLALEGKDPIATAKSLGSARWSDFDIMVEPTVAIPGLCHMLYGCSQNRWLEISVKALENAKRLGAELKIPYVYINEIAGHLLRARYYGELIIGEDVLVHSSNAFVSHYYSLKKSVDDLPSFVEYLASFSSQIKTERTNWIEWVRAIMPDIQSRLSECSITFEGIDNYTENDCKLFKTAYVNYLIDNEIDKKMHLIDHDVYVLQHTNDRILNDNDHWIILTYDKTLISIGQNDLYKGLIITPHAFVNLTETSKPLSESKIESIVYSVASSSDKTLAISARIIDKIVSYASDKLKNFSFKRDIEEFRLNIINNMKSEQDPDSFIDIEVDKFLKSHGVDIDEKENNTVAEADKKEQLQ